MSVLDGVEPVGTPVTAPGLHHDMDEVAYHAHPALSSTGARRLIRPGCPALFAWERDHPTPPTDAMKFGRAAHREILGVGAEIAVTDDWSDFRTKKAQEWRDEQEAAGLLPMLASSTKWQQIQGMKAGLERHETYRRLFDPERGDAEVSAFWTDEETGVACRARFDFLPHPVKGRRLIVPDYKKTTDPEPGAFARDAASYGYPMQADWYLRGVRALGLDDDAQFVFVAQADKPPYLASVSYVSGSDLALAHHRNRLALHTFKACTETGQWPGYDEIAALPMPTYWRIESEDLIDQGAA